MASGLPVSVTIWLRGGGLKEQPGVVGESLSMSVL